MKTGSKPKTPLICISPPFAYPVIDIAIERISRTHADSINLIYADDPDRIRAELEQSGGGFVFFEIRDKDRLMKVVRTAMSVAPLIESGCVRISGVLDFHGDSMKSVLAQKGCSAIYGNDAGDEEIYSEITGFIGDLHAAPPADAGHEEKSKIIWTGAMEDFQDCWILQSENDISRTRGKWIVKLIGPPPSFGKWERQQVAISGATDEAWVFSPRKGRAPFLDDGGIWMFTGGKEPAFSWRDYRWEFVFDSAGLGFMKNEVIAQLKFMCVAGTCSIAENSAKSEELVANISRMLSITAETLTQSSQRIVRQDGAALPESRIIKRAPARPAKPVDPAMKIRNLLDRNQGVDWSRELKKPELVITVQDQEGRNLFNADFIDFYGAELVTRLPASVFSFGDDVLVDFSLTKNNKQVKFQSKAQIVDVQPVNDMFERMILQILEPDPALVKEFMGVFKEHQDSASGFLFKARGLT